MKTLVIVESPTKAKTISKFLGKDFVVESSFGHVRDLPKSKMGIDIEGGTFLPTYTVSKEKLKQVALLKKAASKKEVVFASDEDREGEAISWHLAQVLDIDPAKAKRIVFHEITKSAIEEALKNPRSIDLKLVDAQQARRILDRLVGYELSPLLWKKVARGLSAGRVQSVAVRLIVEREMEIKSFIPQEYWSLKGIFNSVNATEKQNFTATLQAINNKKLDKLDLNNKIQIDEILKNLEKTTYQISDLKKSETKRTPPPPFTTSTLQQNASNRFGFSAKQTMVLAQQLYEGVELGAEGSIGLITYMRTDSVNLSQKFLNEATELIDKNYGKKYSLEKPRFYQNKSKGAQEAHEAIRPADVFRTPESIKEFLSPQQYKLYDLIWRRAVATQMSEAKLNKIAVDISAKQYVFRANGQTMIFAGWLKLFPGMIDEEILPELILNEKLNCQELLPEQHFTEPSARYSDATLVKALEEYGIGRPSTYAPTIATIEDRGYIERDDNKRLFPKPIAFVVNDLLVKHFPNIVDYQFTAQMEKNLDEIAEGTKDWQPIIATFYSPFHELIVKKTEELTKAETTMTRDLGVDPKSGKKVSVRIGRYGAFAQLGDKDDEDKPKFSKLKKGQELDTVTLEDVLPLFELPRSLGSNDQGEEVIVTIGRFGPYAKIGTNNFSLKEQDPYTITLEQVLNLTKEEAERKANIEIKTFPDSTIKILNGRYGPYITDGKKNGKIPKDCEPNSLTLEECAEIIKNAPERRKRFFRKKAK